MKTVTVEQAKSQLSDLIAEATRGGVIVITDGLHQVRLQAGERMNLEEDSPELEEQLLRAVDGPFTDYSPEEMRRIVERIVLHETKA